MNLIIKCYYISNVITVMGFYYYFIIILTKSLIIFVVDIKAS